MASPQAIHKELVVRFCAEARADVPEAATASSLARALLGARPISFVRTAHAFSKAGAAELLVEWLRKATDLELVSSPAPQLCAALQLVAMLTGAADASRRVPVARDVAHATAELRLALREAGIEQPLALLLEVFDGTARLYVYAAVQHLAVDPGIALSLSSGGPFRSIERTASDDTGEALTFGGSEASLGANELFVHTAAYAAGALANVLAHATAACERMGIAPPRVRHAARSAAAARMAGAARDGREFAATRVQTSLRGRAARRRTGALRESKRRARAASLSRREAEDVEAAEASRRHKALALTQRAADAEQMLGQAARLAVAIASEVVAEETRALLLEELALRRELATPAGAAAVSPAARSPAQPSSGGRGGSGSPGGGGGGGDVPQQPRRSLDGRAGRVAEVDALRAALEQAGDDALFARDIGPIPVRRLHSSVVLGFRRLRQLAAVLLQARVRGMQTRAAVLAAMPQILAGKQRAQLRRHASATTIQAVARGMPPRSRLRAKRRAIRQLADAKAGSEITSQILRSAARDAAEEAALLPVDSLARAALEAEAFWLDAAPALDPKRTMRVRARERKAATLIQAHARRRSCRSVLWVRRQHRSNTRRGTAARTIQAFARGMASRTRARHMRAELRRARKHQAAMQIQTIHRSLQAKARVQRERELAVASAIASKRTFDASTRIQAAWRGVKGRERARVYAQYRRRSARFVRSPAQLGRLRRRTEHQRSMAAAEQRAISMQASALLLSAPERGGLGGSRPANSDRALASAQGRRAAGTEPPRERDPARAPSRLTLASQRGVRSGMSRSHRVKYVLQAQQAVAASILQAQHRMRVTRKAFVDARDRARANEMLREMAGNGGLAYARGTTVADATFPGATHVRLKNTLVLRNGALLIFAPGELNQETRRNVGHGYALVDPPLSMLHAEDEPVLQVPRDVEAFLLASLPTALLRAPPPRVPPIYFARSAAEVGAVLASERPTRPGSALGSEQQQQQRQGAGVRPRTAATAGARTPALEALRAVRKAPSSARRSFVAEELKSEHRGDVASVNGANSGHPHRNGASKGQGMSRAELSELLRHAESELLLPAPFPSAPASGHPQQLPSVHNQQQYQQHRAPSDFGDVRSAWGAPVASQQQAAPDYGAEVPRRPRQSLGLPPQPLSSTSPYHLSFVGPGGISHLALHREPALGSQHGPSWLRSSPHSLAQLAGTLPLPEPVLRSGAYGGHGPCPYPHLKPSTSASAYVPVLRLGREPLGRRQVLPRPASGRLVFADFPDSRRARRPATALAQQQHHIPAHGDLSERELSLIYGPA